MSYKKYSDRLLRRMIGRETDKELLEKLKAELDKRLKK